MKKYLAAVLFWMSSVEALITLPTDYLVSFGSNEAPLQIVEYMSLSCAHCISAYQEDFDEIQKQFIEKGLVQWVFHPYPQDEVTMAAFTCMPVLSMEKRRVFLDVLLREAHTAQPSLLLEMVRGFAAKIGKKVPDPRAEGELSGQDIEAFISFLSSTEIDATPLLSVNGVLRMDLRPTLKDIQQEACRHAK